MAIQSFVFKRFHQVLIDLVLFGFAWCGAFLFRFEGPPKDAFLTLMLVLLPFIVFARLLSFYLFSAYTIIWRYVSARDALRLLKATLLPTAILLAARFLSPKDMAFMRVPGSIITLDFLMVFTGTCGIRLLRRLSAEGNDREKRNGKANGNSKKVLLVGAGDAGSIFLKELQNRTDLGMNVVGFVDDDPEKYRKLIHGVRVLGNTAMIPALVKAHGVCETIITIANAASRDVRRIVEICEGAGVRVRIVPGLFEVLDDKIRVIRARDVRIEDLLGRNVLDIEERLPEVEPFYKGKTILVTGAGGSIGSELCRQLARFRPREIVLLDKDENSVYEIDVEMRDRHPEVTATPVIATVKNRVRLEILFDRYRPEVVFHAAAHKHVPLMELNAAEAILNNVGGTGNVVECADKFGVERFIFISSDKAVNAWNVMGATKKIGEVIVQKKAEASKTKFACVRFGNVLGSRGSVVPVFQRQIAAGGPITVTHPDVERYFMSIAEAVQLIIMAGTLGDKGEIFVLDMGKLVKIRELARDLVRLNGLRDDDIPIKYTGLRPGEKLYEEILVDKERDGATKYDRIFVAPPENGTNGDFGQRLEELFTAAREGDEGRIRGCLRGMEIGYIGRR